MAIWITVLIQGLFSVFVTIGRYGEWLTDINLLLRTDSPDGRTDIATLVRRALEEVCTVTVLLVVSAEQCCK